MRQKWSFNVDRSENFTIKNIYISVAKRIIDKDDMIVKANENKKCIKTNKNNFTNDVSAMDNNKWIRQF